MSEEKRVLKSRSAKIGNETVEIPIYTQGDNLCVSVEVPGRVRSKITIACDFQVKFDMETTRIARVEDEMVKSIIGIANEAYKHHNP